MNRVTRFAEKRPVLFSVISMVLVLGSFAVMIIFIAKANGTI